jgi:phosphopentomutase
MKNRILLIILDSVGIGALPDAAQYGDEGSNTLKTCYDSGLLRISNMESLGLLGIDGMDYVMGNGSYKGVYGRMAEKSSGKDTTIGHWEIAGIISPKAMPVYPKGFPASIIEEFERKTGKKALCNKPYSGTEVILDYGREQEETGGLIVYTSADSVFQIAANERDVPVAKLYEYCEMAREMLQGEHGVGRVIARPYVGSYPNYERTANRHDYSLLPPRKTMCNYIEEAGLACIGIGKIYDIFAGSGITKSIKTKHNAEGMEVLRQLVKEKGDGLIFANLVDFDMKYGHRNDILGYVKALNEFDVQLGSLMSELQENDILLIAADHGCDPGTDGTDHTREYIPLLAYGKQIQESKNLGTRETFADIAATILEMLEVSGQTDGKSFADDIFLNIFKT